MIAKLEHLIERHKHCFMEVRVNKLCHIRLWICDIWSK